MFFNAPELFAAWDLNGDGVIDCRDVEWFALPQAPDPEYCPLPRDLQQVAEFVWPVFDTDGSGGLSMAELLRIDDALELAMPLLDTSGDGEASLEEVLALLRNPNVHVFYGLDIERSIWEEGPGIVDYEYLKRFIPPNAFDWLDRDNSGIIDCRDLDLPAPGPAPNPDTVPAALPLPETLDPLTNYLWPFLLAPGDHTLSYHDVDMRFAWASDVAKIPLADMNRDERISRDELALFLAATGALPRTSLPRDSNGDRVYTYKELADWLGEDVLRFIAADSNGNGVIDAGDFEILEVPSDATAAAVLLGMMRSGGTAGLAGLSRTVASDMLAHAGLPEFILDAFDADGNGLITAAEIRHLVSECGLHAADTNGDGALGTVELLRVIQFFNMGGLHCAPGVGASEDGYQAGAGHAHLCMPHTSDYEGEAPDWQISLSELLRVIQFYNAGAYHPCDDPESPDGFCVDVTP